MKLRIFITILDIKLEVQCKWQTHWLGIAVIEGEVLIPSVLDWEIHPSSQANSPEDSPDFVYWA
jgi:hypothetical protein